MKVMRCTIVYLLGFLSFRGIFCDLGGNVKIITGFEKRGNNKK